MLQMALPHPRRSMRSNVVLLASARNALTCSNCRLRDLCMPTGLSASETEALDDIVHARKRIPRGDALFHAGEGATMLFAIRTGSFKTRITLADGRDQVTGFAMSGELLGLDSMGSESHPSDAIALEDSDVCLIPFSRLEKASNEIKSLRRHVHMLMSREIVRENGMMLLLGSMRAEERLAAFLLNFSKRMAARGFSALEFNLRMTREEIGSYLGLKLETVSRTFSRFHNEGIILVSQKHIQILDIKTLMRMCSP